MAHNTTRRRVRPTPATLALLGAGCPVSDLAEALGVTQSAASHYLAGRRRMPDRLPAVLADLIGDAADSVLALIPPFTDHRRSVA